MKKIRWGIIGCGDVTEVKSGPAFNRIENSELVAVMRRNSEKAKDYAERQKVPKWYNRAEELIKDKDINAVYIATPPSSHLYYTIMAAKSGKPVYVEKPMADNYADCIKMIEVCNNEKVPLYVAYYRRELPQFLKVKELVKKNSIGKIFQINLKLHMMPQKADYNKGNLPWRLDPQIAGAGYFYDLAPHQFDLLDYIFDEITDAEGFCTNVGGLYKVEDNVTASWKHKSGVLATGSWNFVSSPKNICDEIELVGERGKIIFPTFEKKPIKVIADEGEILVHSEWPKHIQEPFIKTVVDELSGNGNCKSTGITAARTNWVMDKILGKI